VTNPELRRSRVAVVLHFFILGVATATWAARLPAVKAALHLSDGRLGLALFAFPVGSVATLALSGRIADRFGTVRVLRLGGLLVPVAMIPIAVAPDLTALMAALAVYGAMAGLLDVAMNAAAARLELGYDRPIMSSLHAGYSIAGLAGAGIGGLSAWLGIGLLALAGQVGEGSARAWPGSSRRSSPWRRGWTPSTPATPSAGSPRWPTPACSPARSPSARSPRAWACGTRCSSRPPWPCWSRPPPASCAPSMAGDEHSPRLRTGCCPAARRACARNPGSRT
jgi:MFS family permease